MPPNTPIINIKEKETKDMAKARSLPTPALAKKNMVVASRSPSPPSEMGNRVIAPITGIKMKKYIMFIFTPSANAII